jgi:hypothetical protein
LPVAGSRQFVDQSLRLFEIECVEAFGEPAVNRREKVASLGASPLVAQQAGKADGGAQFPEVGPLLPGDIWAGEPTLPPISVSGA